MHHEQAKSLIILLNLEKKLKKIDENIQELTKTNEKLQTELFYNRICLAIILVFALVYIHYQASEVKDIIGTLIEIFMS